MATYVNDLRLTELATGEGSGTWGTTTNVSLELIGEALGYATQQVFGSDADATTTIADGASDPARAMYFKITSAGSLTATRTCTIAPNTVSRVMFIENATTGSQSIAISQGSGANVTILTGKTAVVYLDGAGSGAAVIDAMAGVDPGVTDTLTEVLVAGNTSGGTNIELSTTDKVQFRDAAIYINSSADGQLDLVADTEIQIAATTVDLNGNLDVSGTALVTGVLTTTAATVFNGGFAAPNKSTILVADGTGDNDWALQISNLESTDDRSFGVKIKAGSTATDTPLFIQTHDAGTTLFNLRGDGTLTVAGVVTANAGVVVDNVTIDGNEIDVSSGDLTLDVAGDIVLDADTQGSGNGVLLKDDGTHYGSFFRSSSNFHIKAEASDQDMIFMGNDGGSEITALTLDMSAAGAATFADDVIADAFLPTAAGAYGSNHVGVYGSGVVLNAATSQTGYIMSAGTSVMTFAPTGGTIQLGGLTAANKLDDYEEGDYNCTVTCSTSGTVTLDTSYHRAGYTKVGRLVTVHGFIVVSSVSSPVGYFKISLPFTPANLLERAGDSAASVVMNSVASANIADFVGTVNEGGAEIIVQLGDSTAVQNDSAQELQANTYISFSTTYSAA